MLAVVGCERACHTYCANLDALPEGDWFCWVCQENRHIDSEGNSTAATGSLASVLPHADGQQKCIFASLELYQESNNLLAQDLPSTPSQRCLKPHMCSSCVCVPQPVLRCSRGSVLQTSREPGFEAVWWHLTSLCQGVAEEQLRRALDPSLLGPADGSVAGWSEAVRSRMRAVKAEASDRLVMQI